MRFVGLSHLAWEIWLSFVLYRRDIMCMPKYSLWIALFIGYVDSGRTLAMQNGAQWFDHWQIGIATEAAALVRIWAGEWHVTRLATRRRLARGHPTRSNATRANIVALGAKLGGIGTVEHYSQCFFSTVLCAILTPWHPILNHLTHVTELFL